MDCLSLGILVADHLCDPIPAIPKPGELVLCDHLPLSIGGCASNVAVDLAKLDVSVGVVGCVGRDVMGQFVIDTLRQAGVDVTHVVATPDAETSATLILNVAGEDRRFIHNPGASRVLSVDHVPWDVVRQCRVLYVGGYLLMPAIDPLRLADLFAQARAAGVRTVLDVVLPGPGDHWARLAPILPQTDLFLPNQDEAGAITGLADPLAQAEKFVQAGARTVVITCGRQGSLLVSGSLRLRAGTFAVEYRGGTGSGDAFDAGYIAGLLQGEDEAGCLRWGSAVGASCVREVSATAGVFSAAEARQFLQSQQLPIERL